MKTNWFLFLFFLGLAFTGKGSDQMESIPGFYLYNTVQKAELKNGEAQINLQFRGTNFAEVPPGYQTVIYYAVNDLIDTLFLDATLSFTLTLKPGKTVFKFWAGPGYNEVISDSIYIENRTASEGFVSFLSHYQLIEVDKPVIYLQSPVELDFTLRVDPASAFSFTYPPYKDEWKGTVFPNGEIRIGVEKYPYLFWDSKQEFQLTKHSNGYRIEKKDLITFLENQLSHTGLTPNERADFITYWGPRMAQHDAVFIQFYLQTDCDQFAKISCTPKPEAINRLYVGFSEWNESFTPYILPVELPAFKRSGFNVLEWGGFEFNSLTL